MKHFITAAGAAIVTALILPAAAQSLSKDIAARIEAIPIQTARHVALRVCADFVAEVTQQRPRLRPGCELRLAATASLEAMAGVIASELIAACWRRQQSGWHPLQNLLRRRG